MARYYGSCKLMHMEVPYSCSIGHCCVQVNMKSQGWLCCAFQTQDSELFGNANHMPLESLSRAMRVIHAFHSDPLILKKTTNSSWLYSWHPSLSWLPYIKWKPCILKKMTLNMHSWLTCFLISLFIYTYPRTPTLNSPLQQPINLKNSWCIRNGWKGL